MHIAADGHRWIQKFSIAIMEKSFTLELQVPCGGWIKTKLERGSNTSNRQNFMNFKLNFETFYVQYSNSLTHLKINPLGWPLKTLSACFHSSEPFAPSKLFLKNHQLKFYDNHRMKKSERNVMGMFRNFSHPLPFSLS